MREGIAEQQCRLENTRQVAQTATLPPKRGRISLAMTGWTRNSRKALRKTVTPLNAMPRVRVVNALAAPGLGASATGLRTFLCLVVGDTMP
jgi:hypothetical protein